METIEKFEEGLTDESRIHRLMSVTVTVGSAIEVSPKRARGAQEDPVMSELDRNLRDMLGIAIPATLQTGSEAK